MTSIAASRMSRAELEREVVELRAVRNGGVRARDLERCQARCKLLELRDAERARELLKARATMRTMERQLAEAREAREAAERNSRQWHALMLQAKVGKIVASDA